MVWGHTVNSMDGKKTFFNSLVFLVELYLEIDLLKITHHHGHFLQLMSRTEGSAM